jgi:hypothetical protein
VKVSSREKMFLIVGVAAVAAALIFYGATKLIPDREGVARDVELKKRMLRSQLDTLSREDIYKTRLEQYQKQMELDMTKLLPGDNATLAGAELQRVLKDFADQCGVEITTRSILPEKKIQDMLVKVSIRIDTNCTPEQLVQFLASIENYEKLLKIDDLTIAGVRLSKKYEIRPSLTISGYIGSREEKPKDKKAANVS